MQILGSGRPESELWKLRPFTRFRRMEIYQYLVGHGITKWQGEEIKPSWYKDQMVEIAEQLHGTPRPVPEVQKVKHQLHDASLGSLKQFALRKILREAGIPHDKAIKRVDAVELIKQHREKIVNDATRAGK